MRIVHILVAISGLGLVPAGAQSVEDYLSQLQGSEPAKRRDAAASLQKFSPSEAVVSALIQATKDESADVRSMAANGLGHFGRDAKRGIPALVEALDDPEVLVRQSAACALANMGADGVPALSRLEALLLDQSAEVRRCALVGLAGLGAANAPAEDVIVQRLQDPSAEVRGAALEALSRFGTAAANYLPQFIAALRDSDEGVRSGAAQAIAALGEAGAPALPALGAALRVPSVRAQESVLSAILTLGVERAAILVPALIDVLNDSDSSYSARAKVALLLADIGEPARVAIPDLIGALNAEHDWIRNAAAAALMKFNPGMTHEQIVALAKSRREKGASSQAAGLDAIENWIAKLTDENSPLHDEAAVELGKAGSAAVPALIHVLQKEKRAPIRLEALRALKTIGYRASAA